MYIRGLLNHIMRIASLILMVIGASIIASSSASSQDNPVVVFVDAFPHVTFDRPLGIRFLDDNTNKVYIAGLGGVIKVMDNDESSDEAFIFLDLSHLIDTSPPGEFHAVEFHPNYETNGYFFVRYLVQDPKRTILSRFERSADNPFMADPDSEVILFEIDVPGFQNHVGGDIAFGPDGYLYVPIGDGGTIHDNAGFSQDMTSLLGKVLRLDVDKPAEGLNYGIPEDNPFVGNDQGWREEIFASGLRNPWRLTIDEPTGEIWVGDVGEISWEEVNLILPGRNYGWPIMEGFECTHFGDPDCDQTGLELPVFAYPWDDGASITGGYVYRGSNIPAIEGHYLFLDYMHNTMWSIDRSQIGGTVQAQWLADAPGHSPTFGQDLDGELFVTRMWSGQIYRLDPGPGANSVEVAPGVGSSLDVFPNPVRIQATIAFSTEPGTVRVTLLDMLGREAALIYDGVGTAFEQRVSFDVGRLPSGLYFVRLEGASEILTRKLLVAR